MTNDTRHNFTVDGVRLVGLTRDELVARLGEPVAAPLWAEAEAAAQTAANVELIRRTIRLQVGDRDSILGTTADATQLNAALLLALTTAMHEQSTFANIRTQFLDTVAALFPTPDGEDDIFALASGFIADVTSENVKLTANVKGLDAVLSEIAQRSTGVAQILEAASAPGVDG